MTMHSASSLATTASATPSPDDLHLSADASVLQRLRVAAKSLLMLYKAPEDPAAGRAFSSSLDLEVFRRHAVKLAQTELGRALFEERPTLQRSSLDLDALRKLPEGTLGRAFADFYTSNEIQPFETPYETPSDGEYLGKWYRETHDLHHIVTGYNTDPVGEVVLQAYVLGNLGFRMSAFVLVFAALVPAQSLPPVWKYWRQLLPAYRRGKQSASLFSIRYDQRLEDTITSVRTSLGIPAAA